MSLLHRVILSSDANPKFLEFWPHVAKAWRHLLGVDVWLALVAEPISNELHRELLRHGKVVNLWPVPGIPISNQAKLARFFLAGFWGDNTVNMVNDIDLLPLQARYTVELLSQRPSGHLLTTGTELYTGPEKGKFTAGYATAESAVWHQLLNSNHYGWAGFIRQFVGYRVFDHKEDVALNTYHENPDSFSDESLLRAVLAKRPVPVTHLARGYAPYTERALCRSNWMFDPEKLRKQVYVEAHLPRPWSAHQDKIAPLLEHLSLLEQLSLLEHMPLPTCT